MWGASGVLPGHGTRVKGPEVKAEPCPGTWVSLQGGLPRPPLSLPALVLVLGAHLLQDCIRWLFSFRLGKR